MNKIGNIFKATSTSYQLRFEAFIGSTQSYFNQVASAVQTHFTNDPEVFPVWQSLSWNEIAQTLINLSNYREKRRSLGFVDFPKPRTVYSAGETPLQANQVKEWAFFASALYDCDDESNLRALLKTHNHQLISYEKNCGVMEPSHFLSMSLSDNVVVIGIKGTNSANDWLTNLFIPKEQLLVVGNNTKEEAEDFGVHSGVLHGARFVKERVGVILQKAFYKAGFSIVVVGHSLGAGVACALAMLLREELKLDRVQCYAFAPPPIGSRLLAQKSREYIYSVVNQDDVISRTGVSQLKNLVLAIKRASELTRAQEGDWSKVEVLLNSLEWTELYRRMTKAFGEDKQYDTYVPGRILFLITGQDSRAVEIDCDADTLRIVLVSPTMVSDHSMSTYTQKLEEICAGEEIPARL